jgi:hypothetical protein
MTKKNETQSISTSDVGTVSAAALLGGATTITTQTAANKAAKAREIFAECYAQSPVPQRKDILARAISEAGLTPAGAATYLQNYKRKEGLSKVAPKAEPAKA